MIEQVLRIKIEFEGSTKPFTTPVEDYIVGLVQKILGENNKWHDNFSAYSISTMQGGVVKDKYMCFPDGGYFYVSSIDMEFIQAFTNNLILNVGKISLRDMKMKGFAFPSSKVHSDYDIIRSISPLLLKVKNKRLVTFKDDDFVYLLTEQSKKKLLHNGFTEKDVQNFEIEPFHFKGASLRHARRKQYSLPASMVMLVVKGNVKCRKALYEMGLGSSTGYCFGAVEISEERENNIN